MSLVRFVCDDCSDTPPLKSIIETYLKEGGDARFYSMFSYLVCKSLGGEEERADNLARVMEAFFLASSIHDDCMDRYDLTGSNKLSNVKPLNDFIVAGDLLFTELAKYFALCVHGLPVQQVEQIANKLEEHLLAVAESQVADIIEYKGKIMSLNKQIEHVRQRGGLWGRMSFELGAMVSGNNDYHEEITNIASVGEKFFMALTLRDDVEDIQDDMANEVFTYPLCWLFENKENLVQKNKLSEEEKIFLERIIETPNSITEHRGQMSKLLDKTGALDVTIEKAQWWVQDAQELIVEVLKKKGELSHSRWSLLKRIMAAVGERLEETVKIAKQQIHELDRGIQYGT
ncbi:MAG: polyprenyl synthetase family protein [Candidatus Hermodarchaeota archaeon]